MRIGIFGGTFDPPHLGHLILADEACSQLGLSTLLWVLTPDPPHKLGQPIRATNTRLEMVRMAMNQNPNFELSRIEIDRPGPHYTLDTVRLLSEQFPGAELIYLIGGDSLRDLPTWHRPSEILSNLSGLGVMRRPGDEINLNALETIIPGIQSKVGWIDAPLLEISSTEIRNRVKEGRPYRYFVPESVYHYICRTGLYA